MASGNSRLSYLSWTLLIFDQNITPTMGICSWVFPCPLPLSLCATSLRLRALTANSILRTSKSLITVQSLSWVPTHLYPVTHEVGVSSWVFLRDLKLNISQTELIPFCPKQASPLLVSIYPDSCGRNLQFTEFSHSLSLSSCYPIGGQVL